jgi:uncharacterized cofD-like protein
MDLLEPAIPVGVQLRNQHIVTIGGGSGPFALLNKLKHVPCHVTAIVTMCDSGGSSRRLMDEFGQLPLGDLRQALVALSRRSSLWREIFTYRFGTSQLEPPSVGGHSLGNLLLAALQNINHGRLLDAIAEAEAILDTAGRVLPVTSDRATLCAELEDGSMIRGESDIDTRGDRATGPLVPIRRIYIAEQTTPCSQAIRALKRADIIVLGPGDLYTSVLPNLLVPGIAEAIRESEAEKVYVCNLMTKRGETDGYKASDFVRTAQEYMGSRLDWVLMHDGQLPEHLHAVYNSQGQHPVEPDTLAVRALGPEVVMDSFIAVHANQLVRHDAEKLLSALSTLHQHTHVPLVTRNHL